MDTKRLNKYGLASKTVAIIFLTVICVAMILNVCAICLAYGFGLYSGQGAAGASDSSFYDYTLDNIVYTDFQNYIHFLAKNSPTSDYSEEIEYFRKLYSSENTNIRFTIIDSQGNTLAQNLDGYPDGLPSTANSYTFPIIFVDKVSTQTLYFNSYEECIDEIERLEDMQNGPYLEFDISGPFYTDESQTEIGSAESEETGAAETTSAGEAAPSASETATTSTENNTQAEEKQLNNVKYVSMFSYSEYETTANNDSAVQPQYYIVVKSTQGSVKNIYLEACVSKNLTAHDSFYYISRFVSFLDIVKYHILYTLIILITVFACVTVFLCSAAGRRKGEETVRPNFIDRIPFDLLLIIYVSLSVLILGICLEAIYFAFPNAFWLEIFFFILSLILVSLMFISFIMTLATRIKLGKWYRNTLIFIVLYFIYRQLKKFFLFIGRCIHNLRSLTKGIIFIAVFLILDVLIFSRLNYMVWFFRTGAIAVLVLMFSLEIDALKKGGKKIAGGDLDSKIDTRNLHFDMKDIAENFNHIGEGLSNAVAEQTKSERMKTELITNVSHDIKTPLTCIINYIDLLKKEEINSPTAKEYIDIIDRQAYRLKKLTEDLVEASKASTGNIAVNKEKIDINLLLSQAAGEYEDKLKEKQIELVLSYSEESAYIECDGRLMWRVLDNLLSNIGKYAQEHTRVYISSEKSNGKVNLTFKNVSKYQLNISADELTERFVRGDSSRNTEGSGLGLSIAKNLTELQGGMFKIEIDGDLFKTNIVFAEKQD